MGPSRARRWVRIIGVRRVVVEGVEIDDTAGEIFVACAFGSTRHGAAVAWTVWPSTPGPTATRYALFESPYWRARVESDHPELTLDRLVAEGTVD